MEIKENLPNVQNALLKVQSTVQGLPLDGLLATAEMVAGILPVPYIDKVIKLLRILIRWRPIANGVMGMGAQAVSIFSPSGGQTLPGLSAPANADMTDEALEESKETADILSMLDEMVEIAAEDGDITPEEEELLIDIAKEAGLNEKAFLAKVKMKCLQKNK